MKSFNKTSVIVPKFQKEPSKIRALLAGHLPPPMGGIATYYQNLLSSSLPEMVNLLFVQTSTHKRSLSQSGHVSFFNLAAAMQDCIRFLRAILAHHPEICHIGTAFGLSFTKHSLCVLIARISGSRVLLHPHCSLSTLYTNRSTWWRWMFRKIIRLTDGVIALSSEWAQLSQIVPGIPVHSLRNAINLEPFQRIAQERILHPRQNGLVHILYLGSIGRDKGSFELLEAARQLTIGGLYASFDLVGSEMAAGESDRLRQMIETEKLSGLVKMHPPVYGEAKLSCFREADIFVYPSYHEGMPMAVIEAMASGLPIVATNVGGLPDLVEQGVNGILVEPGRSDQLADALFQLASDSDLFNSMQKKSAQIATEKFDINQHVLNLVEIYAHTI